MLVGYVSVFCYLTFLFVPSVQLKNTTMFDFPPDTIHWTTLPAPHQLGISTYSNFLDIPVNLTYTAVQLKLSRIKDLEDETEISFSIKTEFFTADNKAVCFVLIDQENSIENGCHTHLLISPSAANPNGVCQDNPSGTPTHNTLVTWDLATAHLAAIGERKTEVRANFTSCPFYESWTETVSRSVLTRIRISITDNSGRSGEFYTINHRFLVQECKTAPCSHRCYDVEAGYFCACPYELQMSVDDHTCEAVIFVAETSGILVACFAAILLISLGVALLYIKFHNKMKQRKYDNRESLRISSIRRKSQNAIGIKPSTPIGIKSQDASDVKVGSPDREHNINKEIPSVIYINKEDHQDVIMIKNPTNTPPVDAADDTVVEDTNLGLEDSEEPLSDI